MTNLEKYVVGALRLSSASAEALLSEIQLKIKVARTDIIRSGVPIEIVEDEDNVLVTNLIIKYVCSEMASIDSERTKSYEAYKHCLDELRKSVTSDAE